MKAEGGIKISNTMIAFVTLVILLGTTMSAAAAYAVGVKTSVERIGSEIETIQTTLEKIEPRIGENEVDIAVIKAHYESIDKSLNEIKQRLEVR